MKINLPDTVKILFLQTLNQTSSLAGRLEQFRGVA